MDGATVLGEASQQRVCTFALSLTFLLQRLGLLHIGGVTALGAPAVDGGQQLTSLGPLALRLPELGEAHRRPQFQGRGLLTTAMSRRGGRRLSPQRRASESRSWRHHLGRRLGDAGLEDACACAPIPLRLPPALLWAVDPGQRLGERREACLGLLPVPRRAQGKQRRPDRCCPPRGDRRALAR